MLFEMAFVIIVYLVGFIWGAAACMWFISYRIGKGRLPKFLKEKKDELIPLLEGSEGGD